MPLISTRGAASAQGFGEFAQSGPVNYIENVFSTYLYTGNGSTQTITNGIDLSGKGGLVWIKGRSTAGQRNGFFDTQRGVSQFIWSDSTASQNQYSGFGVTAFSTSGFTAVDDSSGGYWVNGSNITYASWTFRKQAKFFDVVTWTGDNVNGRVIPHSLNAEVGFIVVKAITTSANDNNWVCRHRSQTSPDRLYLNTTAAASGSTNLAPTTTGFTVYANGYNETGVQYVAYLFAHNAGGFGLSGTDNVISCGSFTTDASGNTSPTTLGYEPQFLLVKRSDGIGGPWYLIDIMRQFSNTNNFVLSANTSDAEGIVFSYIPNATGFSTVNGQLNFNATYIYIAIRRGPMKVPTSGTSVYQPFTYNNSAGGFAQTKNAGFATDFAFESDRTTSANHYLVSRLQGPRAQMASNSTLDEASYNTGGDQQKFDLQNLFAQQNSIDTSALLYCFRRAAGFFDVVCYTGTGVAGLQITHNLAAVPELMLVKRRNGIDSWFVYAAPLGNTKRLFLDSTAAAVTGAEAWNNTTPTATQFTVGNNSEVNGAGSTYVNYLFATVAGVSKVGSYTGTGTTQQINCGFAAGARFVLIKRTNSTGDWYVWDSARGIVAGNDPYLLLNSTAAEVTNTDYVDTYSAGFELSSTAPAALNANGGSFIFLAIA